MVGPNTESVTLNNMYNSTHPKWKKELVDALHDEYTCYGWITRNKGRGEGRRGEFSVKYQGYNNVSSNGFDSATTVTPENPNISIGGNYNWGTYELFPQITYDAMRANEGSKRKYNYVKEQLDEAEMSIQKSINESLWVGTQNTNKFTSIAVVVSTTTGSGTVHNISRSTYQIWRQVAQDCSAVPFTSGGINNMRTLYNNVSRGQKKNKPDTIFSNATCWGLYERLTDAKDFLQMTRDGAKGTKLSEAFQFRTCLWMWDDDYPESTTLRMLNSEFWDYEEFSTTMPGKPIPAGNGRFETMEMSIVGQLYCTALKFQGILHNFTAA